MISQIQCGLLANSNAGVVRGAVIFILLGCGCLGLAAKAFSAGGIPVTSTYYLKGKPAMAIGIAVGLFGAALIGVPLFILMFVPNPSQ